ncbi:hypothetical protein [Kitasatospora sp. NBC_01300]|nr:hypothetical protein OG556_34370 [Kitasatospora sp. NBC_01300]
MTQEKLDALSQMMDECATTFDTHVRDVAALAAPAAEIEAQIAARGRTMS